jgi:KDO2-lipid IV(A) lauroyltransferase
MRRLLQLIPFVLLVVITFPFALLPYRVALQVGNGVGLLIYLLWGSRRKIALENLRSALDRGAITLVSDPRSVIRQNFANLGKSLIELIKIYYGFGDSVFRTVELKGAENFRKAQKRGKGVISITGHCGNWELMGIYMSVNLGEISVVARRQNNFYINSFIERTRERFGNSVIYKEGALRKILSALKKKETVGILMDQSVIRSEGLIIHFLGRNAYAMKTPAIIARKTGTPVVPAFIRRTERGHVIEIGEEIPLDTSADSDAALFNDTVNFSRTIEDFIRQYPADWLWIHRRWKRIKE